MKKMNLRSRFVVFATVAALIPLCLSLFISVRNNQKMSNMAVESVLKLGQSDISRIDSTEKDSLSAQNAIRDLERNSNYFFLLAAGIMLLLVIWASIFYSRKITGPIMQTVSGLFEGAEHTILASKRVAESSLSVAEGSTEQAASVEETSSSLEEMAAMTQRNAENVQEADNLMQGSKVFADKAVVFMGELTGSMKDISKASEETSKIIKTIDEIAFQTNLLALNAAVEAARAGEAGAGFAVVADEVRNLAMRAAQAANTTSQLLEGTVQKVKKGEELVSHTNDVFKKMTEGGSQVAQLLGEIAAASSEQATGIEQINKAVSEIDKVIQTNAEGSEANVEASKEMSNQAEKMRQYVMTLAAVVIGSEVLVEEKGDSSQEAAAPQNTEHVTREKSLPPKARRVLHPANTIEVPPEQILPLDEDFEEF